MELGIFGVLLPHLFLVNNTHWRVRTSRPVELFTDDRWPRCVASSLAAMPLLATHSLFDQDRTRT